MIQLEMTKLSEILPVVEKAARAAGEVHKKYYAKPVKHETKDLSYNLVTEADVEAEKCVVSHLRTSFSQANFLAEEAKYEQVDSDWLWIVDPLDGTNNFSRGFPIFCVSIGLAYQGKIVLGVVYNAMHDECYTAYLGGGAYLNDQKIQVNQDASLDQSLLVTGFYYDRGKDMEDNLEVMKRFYQKHVLGLRRLGAAALDLCYVAVGRLSGYWEFQLSPWDFAAGKIICEEAGGKVTDVKGNPLGTAPSSITASNGKIHDAMLEVIGRK